MYQSSMATSPSFAAGDLRILVMVRGSKEVREIGDGDITPESETRFDRR